MERITCLAVMFTLTAMPARAGEHLGYAQQILAEAGKEAEIRGVTELGHSEAFRIVTDGDKKVIECRSEAGLARRLLQLPRHVRPVLVAQ